MAPTHILLALLVAALWGFTFVVIKFGLGTFPPFLLVALRFLLAATPALVLRRPPVNWPRLFGIASTLFVGHFGFLFLAMTKGVTPGLASVLLQSQGFFTILVAALALRELPSGRQVVGIGVALAGLLLIASTAGGDVTVLGLCLTILGALSWAVGNVLLKRGTHPGVDMFSLIVWLNLVATAPAFALSLVFDGPAVMARSLGNVGWGGVAALLYIAGVSSLVGFSLWGYLLRRYPAGRVAPFSMLVPVFGALSSALILGETFGPRRLVGMALILLGLALVMLPAAWFGLKGKIAPRPAALLEAEPPAS